MLTRRSLFAAPLVGVPAATQAQAGDGFLKPGHRAAEPVIMTYGPYGELYWRMSEVPDQWVASRDG